jgi:NADH:ubiquinone oxidoreductase subunit K
LIEAPELGMSGWLVLGSLALFWIGALGLLWRRSLVGMLVGLVFGWVSVALAAIGLGGLQDDPEARAAGGALVLCVVLLAGLQVAVGLAAVVARIRRHGTLDADDAGLLEG